MDSVAGTARQQMIERAYDYFTVNSQCEDPETRREGFEEWVLAADFALAESSGLRTQLEQAQRERAELESQLKSYIDAANYLSGSDDAWREASKRAEAAEVALSSLQGALRQIAIYTADYDEDTRSKQIAACEMSAIALKALGER